MPTLEPLPFGVVKWWHIGLGAQQCVWLLVTISAAIPGDTRHSGAPRSGAQRFLDPLLAMRLAAVVELPFDPRHDPAHFRQTAQ